MYLQFTTDGKPLESFLKSNRNKVYYSYQLEIKENYLIPKNHNDFINNTFTDEWNHLIFLRIIKYLKSKKN